MAKQPQPVTASIETTKPAAVAPKKPAAPSVLHVLDLTATAASGKRTHEMIVDGVVKQFAFEPGIPLALPNAVALKFLKHTEGFKFTDAAGNLKEFKRRPKQPDELQAGETLVLTDDQTIATFDELSTAALQHRVLEMPGSDAFAENPSRTGMIRFLVERKIELKKANASSKPDIGADEFDPLAGMVDVHEDLEDEAA